MTDRKKIFEKQLKLNSKGTEDISVNGLADAVSVAFEGSVIDQIEFDSKTEFIHIKCIGRETLSIYSPGMTFVASTPRIN